MAFEGGKNPRKHFETRVEKKKTYKFSGNFKNSVHLILLFLTRFILSGFYCVWKLHCNEIKYKLGKKVLGLRFILSFLFFSFLLCTLRRKSFEKSSFPFNNNYFFFVWRVADGGFIICTHYKCDVSLFVISISQRNTPNEISRNSFPMLTHYSCCDVKLVPTVLIHPPFIQRSWESADISLSLNAMPRADSSYTYI